jgi:hypothetical protein
MRLEIVNLQKQLLAQIVPSGPDGVEITVFNGSMESEFKEFVERRRHEGVPLRTSRQIEKDGETVIVEEQITVKPGHPQFFEALADAISKAAFGGQRALALVRG